MTLPSARLPSLPIRYEYGLLSVCVGSYFAVRYTQIIVSPLIPDIIATFDVSRGAIGLALTGMWLTYAFSQLPSGVLADWIGGRHVVTLALAITAACAVGLAIAPGFGLLALVILLLGVGAGIYYNPATTLLTREFAGIGRAIGTHRIGGQTAGAIAPIVASLLSVRVGWRTTMLTGAAVAIAVAIVFAAYTRPTPTEHTASTRPPVTLAMLRSLLRQPSVRYTTLLMTLVEFTGLAAMAFIPIFLVEHYGFSVAAAGLAFAVFFITSAAFQPISGWFSDRVGRDQTIAILTLLGVLGYGTLSIGLPTLLIIPAVIVTGIAGSVTPVVQSRMIDALDPGLRGTGFGVFRTGYMLLGSVGPTVVGVTADGIGWGPAFGLMAISLALVTILVITTRLA